MTTKTQGLGWISTHQQFHCPRRQPVPAWDPLAGGRVLFIETDVKHARPERPLGDILVYEGLTFWANPDTPAMREHLAKRTIVPAPAGKPAVDPREDAERGLDTVLADRTLIGRLDRAGISTADELLDAYVSGQLRSVSGVTPKAVRGIGNALVTAGLLAPQQLAD